MYLEIITIEMLNVLELFGSNAYFMFALKPIIYSQINYNSGCDV